jgi:hypothetical protein
MAESTFDWFKTVLYVMLFYSVSITLITQFMPSDMLDYAYVFTDGIDDKNLNYDEITQEVQGGLDQQSNVPLIEVGALVFYSGNILVDLILNFITAIPQMITLLINGIALLFANGIDVVFLGIIEGFATASIIVFYIIGLISLTTGIRSGRVI